MCGKFPQGELTNLRVYMSGQIKGQLEKEGNSNMIHKILFGDLCEKNVEILCVCVY